MLTTQFFLEKGLLKKAVMHAIKKPKTEQQALRNEHSFKAATSCRKTKEDEALAVLKIEQERPERSIEEHNPFTRHPQSYKRVHLGEGLRKDLSQEAKNKRGLHCFFCSTYICIKHFVYLFFFEFQLTVTQPSTLFFLMIHLVYFTFCLRI